MAFALSHWPRNSTFLSGTLKISYTSAKEKFCATFDRQPLTRSLQSAIMILLVGRPPEAPYLSRAEHLLYAHQAAGNYQQGGRQPAEHILFSFQEMLQKRTPGYTAGCFLYVKKKPPLGHLPWITGRGAGGLIASILQRVFGKVKNI